MAFGLKNAPGMFQRVMEVLHKKVKWQCALIYLDDFIILLRTPDEHIRHIRLILTLLQNAGVTLKFKICKFFSNRINQLGHVIQPWPLQVSTDTLDAICRLRNPTTVTEFQSSLGLCKLFLCLCRNLLESSLL